MILPLLLVLGQLFIDQFLLFLQLPQLSFLLRNQIMLAQRIPPIGRRQQLFILLEILHQIARITYALGVAFDGYGMHASHYGRWDWVVCHRLVLLLAGSVLLAHLASLPMH